MRGKLIGFSITMLIAVGAGFLVGWLEQPYVSTPASVHTSAPPVAHHAPKPVAGIPVSVPIRVRIPAIKVDAPVMKLGLDAHGALELPPLDNHNLAGWYTGSVTPGKAGPAILAGHVDSTTGTSVFFNIKSLRPGDKIMVTEADGMVVKFTTQWVQTAPKDAFPTAAVYGDTPDPTLRLITCGGEFDPSTGHYDSNVIVYASL